ASEENRRRTWMFPKAPFGSVEPTSPAHSPRGARNDTRRPPCGRGAAVCGDAPVTKRNDTPDFEPRDHFSTDRAQFFEVDGGTVRRGITADHLCRHWHGIYRPATRTLHAVAVFLQLRRLRDFGTPAGPLLRPESARDIQIAAPVKSGSITVPVLS